MIALGRPWHRTWLRSSNAAPAQFCGEGGTQTGVTRVDEVGYIGGALEDYGYDRKTAALKLCTPLEYTHHFSNGFFTNLLSSFTDNVCSGGDLPEVEIISLLEEQIPRYRLRADTLTQFTGYENRDWYIPSPALKPEEADVKLTSDQIRETLNYFRLMLVRSEVMCCVIEAAKNSGLVIPLRLEEVQTAESSVAECHEWRRSLLVVSHDLDMWLVSLRGPRRAGSLPVPRSQRLQAQGLALLQGREEAIQLFSALNLLANGEELERPAQDEIASQIPSADFTADRKYQMPAPSVGDSCGTTFQERGLLCPLETRGSPGLVAETGKKSVARGAKTLGQAPGTKPGLLFLETRGLCLPSPSRSSREAHPILQQSEVTDRTILSSCSELDVGSPFLSAAEFVMCTIFEAGHCARLICRADVSEVFAENVYELLRVRENLALHQALQLPTEDSYLYNAYLMTVSGAPTRRTVGSLMNGEETLVDYSDILRKFSRVAECRSEVGSARFLWMLAVCLDGCHVTRNGPLMARIFPISCDFSWSSGGQDLARPKSRRVHGPSERRFFRRLYRRQATTLTSPREFKKFLTVNFALPEHIWPEPRNSSTDTPLMLHLRPTITQAFVEMSLSHFTSQHDIHLVLRSAADKQVIKIPVNYHVAGTCAFVLIANKCFHEKAYQILRLTAFLLFRCSESTDAHSILPSRQHFCLPSGLFPRVLQPKPFLLRILEVPGSNLSPEAGYPRLGLFVVFLGPSRQIPDCELRFGTANGAIPRCPQKRRESSQAYRVMASYCHLRCPVMVFPDARCQQDDDDLDLSPDGEERMTMGDDDEEDPYEYDDELPRMPDSAEPNFLDDDLILEEHEPIIKSRSIPKQIIAKPVLRWAFVRRASNTSLLTIFDVTPNRLQARVCKKKERKKERRKKCMQGKHEGIQIIRASNKISSEFRSDNHPGVLRPFTLRKSTGQRVRDAAGSASRCWEASSRLDSPGLQGTGESLFKVLLLAHRWVFVTRVVLLLWVKANACGRDSLPDEDVLFAVREKFELIITELYCIQLSRIVAEVFKIYRLSRLTMFGAAERWFVTSRDLPTHTQPCCFPCDKATRTPNQCQLSGIALSVNSLANCGAEPEDDAYRYLAPRSRSFDSSHRHCPLVTYC
ncbi:Trafficking kinesin-binding protein 1 [Zootermopsis nevadensis]|uniref:Trafficking kinesin-binding protein 1 n=1 Tax=Zootermopsis nevadensis TaxID=136037 RepID=A0A067RHA4_ZOONE|nr:Trafficking kinesin-binding protein 1 [Zootermopsis nevadensis]